MFKFPEYPKNWEDMREAMFRAYGGKYCIKSVFMMYGHEGFINLHHHVPLSKAKNNSEYFFLNQEWNLVPYCEKHHDECHDHMNKISGDYKVYLHKTRKKVSWARRFCWWLKRHWYSDKFEKRGDDEKVLWSWNYWSRGEKKLEEYMNNWPREYLEDKIRTR